MRSLCLLIHHHLVAWTDTKGRKWWGWTPQGYSSVWMLEPNMKNTLNLLHSQQGDQGRDRRTASHVSNGQSDWKWCCCWAMSQPIRRTLDSTELETRVCILLIQRSGIVILSVWNMCVPEHLCCLNLIWMLLKLVVWKDLCEEDLIWKLLTIKLGRMSSNSLIVRDWWKTPREWSPECLWQDTTQKFDWCWVLCACTQKSFCKSSGQDSWTNSGEMEGAQIQKWSTLEPFWHDSWPDLITLGSCPNWDALHLHDRLTGVVNASCQHKSLKPIERVLVCDFGHVSANRRWLVVVTDNCRLMKLNPAGTGPTATPNFAMDVDCSTPSISPQTCFILNHG